MNVNLFTRCFTRKGDLSNWSSWSDLPNTFSDYCDWLDNGSLTILWVTLDHLVAGLKAGCCDGVHSQLLMISGLSGHQGGVGGQGVVDPGIGNLVTDKYHLFIKTPECLLFTGNTEKKKLQLICS